MARKEQGQGKDKANRTVFSVNREVSLARKERTGVMGIVNPALFVSFLVISI